MMVVAYPADYSAMEHRELGAWIPAHQVVFHLLYSHGLAERRAPEFENDPGDAFGTRPFPVSVPDFRFADIPTTTIRGLAALFGAAP
jgi:hypothetical protein